MSLKYKYLSKRKELIKIKKNEFEKDICNIIHNRNIILQGKLKNKVNEIPFNNDENYCGGC